MNANNFIEIFYKWIEFHELLYRLGTKYFKTYFRDIFKIKTMLLKNYFYSEKLVLIPLCLIYLSMVMLVDKNRRKLTIILN